MIGRSFRRNKTKEHVEVRGFDAFELRLGDVLRGERATMGKSLLDVQRELKIKAAYVAAIENADPTAFDTPGFIAGYVRSYARYLDMDPDWAFDTFCTESGFATAHGMSSDASSVKPSREERLAARPEKDIFSAPSTPFIPAGEAMFARVEPGAIGSVLVLIALVAGLGFGGWTVLQEVQKVQLAPVEQAPIVSADIDPLAGNATSDEGEELAGFTPPSAEAMDRLYRPQALEVPVMVARDGPISTLDPRMTGVFAPLDTPQLASAPSIGTAPAQVPAVASVQVVEENAPDVVLIATRPAWVRIRSADGTVIFEKILGTGEEYVLPATVEPPVLRAGNSGSLYFKVNGVAYGPAGPGTQTAKNVALAPDLLREAYSVADLNADPALAEVINVAQAQINP
jgi:cytoskeletal protein RodZ